MNARENVMLNEEEDFLSHLPSDTTVIHYDPNCDLRSIWPTKSPHDTFVVIKGVTSQVFDRLDEKLPGRLDYSSSLQILILKMPSLPHEVAACKFDHKIHDLATHMKVVRRIVWMGSTRIEGEDRKKQADRAWMPTRQGGIFPTVALEIGYSETTAKLERDIYWWLHESKGRMKMGITIDIKRVSGNIEIKSWILSQPPSKHVYITAHGRQIIDRNYYHQLELQIAQKISIKRGKKGQEPTITGGNLIIPFQSLLLEEPKEGEGDFVFSEDMLLHDIAEPIWDGIDREEVMKREK